MSTVRSWRVEAKKVRGVDLFGSGCFIMWGPEETGPSRPTVHRQSPPSFSRLINRKGKTLFYRATHVTFISLNASFISSPSMVNLKCKVGLDSWLVPANK